MAGDKAAVRRIFAQLLGTLSLGTLSFGTLTACQVQAPEQEESTVRTEDAVRWSDSDNPSIMSSDLVYTLTDLPTIGEVTAIPWPGSYWPTFLDSINFRWAGDDVPSAAEKYGQAFGIANMEDRVSAYSGILSLGGTQCSTDGDCNPSYGEACAKRRGAALGSCVPTWFGICHAWAPASIKEPEPLMSVLRNGVTFRANDLKALMTLSYNQTSSKFVSLRCNESNGRGEIEFDVYGRPNSAHAACSDTNPGTFHVLVANYLGIRKRSFVEDKIFDDQVWNQPLRGYEVLEQREVTAREANTLVGVTGSTTTTISKSGAVVRSTWVQLGNYAVKPGQRVTVNMTGTGDADLYVRFGAQPTTTSYACRPYLDGSTESCDLVAPQGASQVYVAVRGYSLLSTFNVNIALEGSLDTYQFNPDATRFFYVKTNLAYIFESGIGDDGNLSGRIDSYTAVDTYEYVLELDRNGRIIGGEWLNGSKTSHPDFVWLPLDRTPGSDMPLDYTKVKSLLDESVGANPSGNFVTVRESGTVEAGQWAHYGPFTVVGGSIRVTLTGTNDADLYVRRGATPTFDTFDCRPYIDGSGESCEVAGQGPVYVSVAGYAPSSDYTVEITYLSTNAP